MSVNRLCMLSPRIRYNIHGSGDSHSLATVRDVCRDFGLDPLDAQTPPGQRLFLLPFLAVRGRSDATISCMGRTSTPRTPSRRCTRTRGTRTASAATCHPYASASRCYDAKMPKTRTTVTLDGDVLRAVRVRAAREGKGDSQIIEEALRRDLGLDLLERLWAQNDLDEAEAVRLAVEAQNAARRRRRH